MDARDDRAKALLELLWQQGKDHALIMLDPDGRVVGWPLGACNLFGWTAEEMAGETLEAMFTPEDRTRGVPHGELEIGTKVGKSEDDRWLVRKDGVRMWVSGILTCLRDGEGRVVGFSKVLRDRTDVKEQVDVLRARIASLDAEDRRKTVLIGTLAHELRNPLGVLTNAVHLIEMAYPQDDKLTYATQLIARQTRYLNTLIEDLLEGVRLREGKVVLQRERVELGDVLRAALETVGAAIREKAQHVELLLPQTRIVLDADPTRLQQVFVNLLHNASKFSRREGDIWVKGTTEGDEAVIRVEDRGRGIAPELLPRLFDLFTQGEPGGDGGIGLGLGLPIVKQYVELHGGTVQARSEGVGRGSEFVVRLPLVPEAT